MQMSRFAAYVMVAPRRAARHTPRPAVKGIAGLLRWNIGLRRQLPGCRQMQSLAEAYGDHRLFSVIFGASPVGETPRADRRPPMQQGQRCSHSPDSVATAKTGSAGTLFSP